MTDQGMQTCGSCRYRKVNLQKDPCASCDDFSLYEAREPEEKHYCTGCGEPASSRARPEVRALRRLDAVAPGHLIAQYRRSPMRGAAAKRINRLEAMAASVRKRLKRLWRATPGPQRYALRRRMELAWSRRVSDPEAAARIVVRLLGRAP